MGLQHMHFEGVISAEKRSNSAAELFTVFSDGLAKAKRAVHAAEPGRQCRTTPQLPWHVQGSVREMPPLNPENLKMDQKGALRMQAKVHCRYLFQ